MAILVIIVDKMANFGPIQFKICLYIKVNVNDGQTNLICQNGHRLEKIGQMPLLYLKGALLGHFSTNFDVNLF